MPPSGNVNGQRQCRPCSSGLTPSGGSVARRRHLLPTRARCPEAAPNTYSLGPPRQLAHVNNGHPRRSEHKVATSLALNSLVFLARDLAQYTCMHAPITYCTVQCSLGCSQRGIVALLLTVGTPRSNVNVIRCCCTLLFQFTYTNQRRQLWTNEGCSDIQNEVAMCITIIATTANSEIAKTEGI